MLGQETHYSLQSTDQPSVVMPTFTAVCSSTQSAAFSFITTVSKKHLHHKMDGLRLQQISKRTVQCPRVLLTPSPQGFLAPIPTVKPQTLSPSLWGPRCGDPVVPAAPVTVQTSI